MNQSKSSVLLFEDDFFLLVVVDDDDEEDDEDEEPDTPQSTMEDFDHNEDGKVELAELLEGNEAA